MKLKNDVVYLVQWKEDCEGSLKLSVVQPYNGHLYDYTGEWYCDEEDVLRAVEMGEVIEVLDRLDKWTDCEGEKDE